MSDAEYHQMDFKGAKWLRIFYHNVQFGGVFRNAEEAKHSINKYKFSIIEDVSKDHKYKYEGKYEFLIQFSDTSGYNWWRQSIFPLFEDDNTSIGTTVKGYEEVSISLRDRNWGGLAHTVRKYSGCIPCLLDGSIQSEKYFYTIGSNNCNKDYPDTTPSNNNPGANEVTLWMRISSFGFKSCQSYKRRNSINLFAVCFMIQTCST